MLGLVFTGTAGSSVRVIFNYSNRSRGPPSPFRSSLALLFFVLYLLVHHLTLPFVYDDQNKNRSTARVRIFDLTERRDAVSSNLLIYISFSSLFVSCSLFCLSTFFAFSYILFIVKMLSLYALIEDDRFSDRLCACSTLYSLYPINF